MQHFDFTPLYRSTIGFDRLVNLLDQAGGPDQSGYPPYNIEATGDDAYRITMAVAGFAADDISIAVKESGLTITATKSSDEPSREYLHRGIAQRSFERRFQLADYVEVVGADLRDGLLHVELKRNLPERMKPRTIAITSDGGTTESSKQIEAQV